jgi:hypothetical protein
VRLIIFNNRDKLEVFGKHSLDLDVNRAVRPIIFGNSDKLELFCKHS